MSDDEEAYMVREVPHADAETITLDRAVNGAMQSLWSRRDPVVRAAAAAQVAERLNHALRSVAECRSRSVAEATLLPGMSMAKVADDLGIAKSTVAKLAGPATYRDEIASQMRSKLEAAFDFGANEGRRRR